MILKHKNGPKDNGEEENDDDDQQQGGGFRVENGLSSDDVAARTKIPMTS